MTGGNDDHAGGEYAGNAETGTLQSILEAFPRDSGNCLNCGVRLPERKRRHGSARRSCSPRCRKLAWLSRTQSVPGVNGHVAKKRERLGLTERAAAITRTSTRTVRRGQEMLRLLEESYGPENAMEVFRKLERGGKKINTLLREEKERQERLVVDYVLGRTAIKSQAVQA